MSSLANTGEELAHEAVLGTVVEERINADARGGRSSLDELHERAKSGVFR